ncbi:MAG: c-type cytochrome [Verrucomicrobiales bacterium]
MPRSLRRAGSIVLCLVSAFHFATSPVSGSTPDSLGRIPVLVDPGPWNATPVAPGQSNYRLVIEYSAEAGHNAMVSLEGWKRLLPAGEKMRAEFAIEDADGSPYIVRHWRPGRDRPDSTDRPRRHEHAAAPEVTLTAPEGFQIHRAFVQPLRESDHGELWAKATTTDATIGSALYRDHCLACHGDGNTIGRYPGLAAWKERDVSLSTDPHSLWRAIKDPDGSAPGHPRLTDEEAYQVLRYLRDNLLSTNDAEPGSSELPRGRVLSPPEESSVSSSAPWRRMDHGPFLFQPLRILDAEGKTSAEVAHSLVVRLDPGIGGVTRGRAWAVYDVGDFRFLGIARGGRFSDSSAIFDGNGDAGLTLQGATLEKEESSAEAGEKAVFKAVTVSGSEVAVLSTINGTDFSERFFWRAGQKPTREYGPLENGLAPGKADPLAVEVTTRLIVDEQNASAPLVVEGIPAPAPEELITGSWMRFTGLAMRNDGSALLCTPNGEVWLVRGLDSPKATPRWRRFASGLDGPHRLSTSGGVLEARCRNGRFRLFDENNDGFCERYERKAASSGDTRSELTDRLTRWAAPSRTADDTWYFAAAATESNPGAGFIRNQGGPPEDAEPPVYVWLPGAESSPPAGPVWLPATGKWGGGLQSGTLMPCRDSGKLFRLWSARPGDLSMPRVLWSLPVPPVDTDIMASSFSGSSLYICGIPLDEETPPHAAGFWRIRRQNGHLFHPVEFDADDQSVTLRFNSPLDPAATAASRFVRVTAWKPDAGFSEAKPVAPRRVLLGRNTMRVVSDVIEPGAGFSLECSVTDGQGLAHRFDVHFTLPAELPPAILPAPRSRPLPPPVVAGVDDPLDPDDGAAADPAPEDLPAFELPGRLPELDDPVEEEEPLPKH